MTKTNITAGEGLKDINFENIISIDDLQELQNAVSKNQNIASVIVDINGNYITKPTNFSSGLISAMRELPAVFNYFKTDFEAGIKTEAKSAEVMKNEMKDVFYGSIPIIFQGEKIATWLVGFAFDAGLKKDINDYMQLIDGENFDRGLFEEAVNELPVMSEAEFIKVFEMMQLFESQLLTSLESKFKHEQELKFRQELLNELEETNVALELQAERYRLITECTDEIIFEYNVKTDSLVIPGVANSRHQENILIEEYAASQKYKSIIFSEDISIYEQFLINDIPDEKDLQIELRINIFSDEYVWYRINLVFFRNDQNKLVRIIGRAVDIEKEKLEMLELENRVKKDPMTGLLNKAATKLSADKFFRETDPDAIHAVMIVDIDDFKTVNDTFGHLFGDMVIENVATAISTTFRKSDIIGRIGGDEFIVVMKATGRRITEIKARDLCKKVKTSYSANNGQVEVSISVGIAFYGSDGKTFDELFKCADSAMYNAKLRGKNTVEVYDKSKEKNYAGLTDREENIVNPRGGSDYDVDFVNVALRLLLEANDIDIAVKILSERIFDKYAIQKMVYNYVDKELDDNIFVVENSGVVIKKKREDYENYTLEGRRILSKQIISIGDCVKETEEEEIARFGLNYGAAAMVATGIIQDDKKDEFLVFINTDAPRSWTEYEKKTFYQLSHVFSIFARLQRERLRSTREIENLNALDPVTGLYNKKGFAKKIEEIMDEYEDSKKYAMVYLDIDDFSYVNDNFGMRAGNEVLQDMAGVLKTVRSSVACRDFADHFLVFYYYSENTDILETVNMQAEMFERIEKAKYANGRFKFTAGIYNMMYMDRDISGAIDNANFARKKIKHVLKTNAEIYNSEMSRERDFEQRVLMNFEQAIERQDFEMFLLPKMSLITDDCVGAEALARWKQRDGSYWMPGQFVPVLEKYGLIPRLDYAIFEMALKTVENWIKEGKEAIPISVNFSKNNTNANEFVPYLMNLYNQYSTPKHLVEVEVNESAFAEKKDVLYNNLEMLRQKGVVVYLDDFGKGHSSLDVLVEAPVDAVKMDKVLLDGVDESVLKQEYISNICGLISSVKKQIVVAGVETQEQADFLYSCGISYVQGFLYGEPKSIEDFTEEYLLF